jgi:hypothetical protein
VTEDVGVRAVEWIAHQIGTEDQIHQARDIYNRAVEGAQEAAHAAAREIGVEGAINVTEVGVGLVTAVEGLAGHAVDAGVDFIADVVGAAVDWVAHNVFTVDDGAGHAQQQAQQADQGVQQAADQQQAVDDNAADDNAAGDDAGDQGAGQQDDEGGSFQSWESEVSQVAQEIEALQPAVAVRELLALRARMIGAQTRGQRTNLRR